MFRKSIHFLHFGVYQADTHQQHDNLVGYSFVLWQHYVCTTVGHTHIIYAQSLSLHPGKNYLSIHLWTAACSLMILSLLCAMHLFTYSIRWIFSRYMLALFASLSLFIFVRCVFLEYFKFFNRSTKVRHVCLFQFHRQAYLVHEIS